MNRLRIMNYMSKIEIDSYFFFFLTKVFGNFFYKAMFSINDN